jgi:sugar phosphate isomerase/epimerase
MSDGPDVTRFRVGIDNYGLFPLELDPLGTLRWAADHGAEGVAFSGLADEQQASLDRGKLEELATYAREHHLYLEWGGARHVPRDMTTWSRKDLFDTNRLAAEQAAALGARVLRSCSGGMMRWQEDAPTTETLLREAAGSLRGQRSMLRDYNVTLAIETHFEFTSHELVRLIDLCQAPPGDWLGICLDTMNLLTLAEEPVSATRRLLPWVVSTHIKDGGVLLDAAGLVTFTAPLGSGVVDLPAIIDLLGSLDREVHLSAEDHAGSTLLPIFDPMFLSKLPDLSATELAQLVSLARRTTDELTCRPLPRSAWSQVCESRMIEDLRALRTIAGRRVSEHESS